MNNHILKNTKVPVMIEGVAYESKVQAAIKCKFPICYFNPIHHKYLDRKFPGWCYLTLDQYQSITGFCEVKFRTRPKTKQVKKGERTEDEKNATAMNQALNKLPALRA